MTLVSTIDLSLVVSLSIIPTERQVQQCSRSPLNATFIEVFGAVSDYCRESAWQQYRNVQNVNVSCYNSLCFFCYLTVLPSDVSRGPITGGAYPWLEPHLHFAWRFLSIWLSTGQCPAKYVPHHHHHNLSMLFTFFTVTSSPISSCIHGRDAAFVSKACLTPE